MHILYFDGWNIKLLLLSEYYKNSPFTSYVENKLPIIELNAEYEADDVQFLKSSLYLNKGEVYCEVLSSPKVEK